MADVVAEDRAALRHQLVGNIGGVGKAEAELLETLRRCDRAEFWRLDGARNAAEWTSAWTGWSQWKARRVLAATHALPSLPLIAAAHRAGALCLEKVVELTRFATAETEEQLLKWACNVSVGRVRERADEEVGRKVEEVQSAYDARSVTMTRDSEHWYLDAQLPLDQGEIVEAALKAVARDLPFPVQREDETDTDYAARSRENRDADAFFSLITSACDRRKSSTADETTLLLHATADDLAEADGAIASPGGVLHSETLRRLTCDCRVQTVLEDANLKPLGVGRETRKIPRRLRRAVLRRDGWRCTFPGCECRRDLVIHHVQHWGLEGETELYNLIAVCRLHHNNVHEDGWSVILQGETTTWFRPSGRTYDPGIPAPTEASTLAPDAPTLAEAAGLSRLFDIMRPKVPPSTPPEPRRLKAAKQNRRRERQLRMSVLRH